jgi:hypothetical protein
VWFGLTIKSPDIDSSVNNTYPTIENTYYVVNSEVIAKEKDYITYRFVMVSYQSLLLHNSMNYATNKTAGAKSPYKIIQEVLSSVRI